MVPGEPPEEVIRELDSPVRPAERMSPSFPRGSVVKKGFLDCVSLVPEEVGMPGIAGIS